ncbi:hypothetical protein K1719_045616 [Acacia pycnantha]|nr:hypothetical protein K1719_045616 [Acacia pycnantha]
MLIAASIDLRVFGVKPIESVVLLSWIDCYSSITYPFSLFRQFFTVATVLNSNIKCYSVYDYQNLKKCRKLKREKDYEAYLG